MTPINFLEKTIAEWGKNLLVLDSSNEYLIGESKVYMNSHYLRRETVYLDKKLNSVDQDKAFYQVFFTEDHTQFGFNTLVQGNKADRRCEVGFNNIKGEKLVKIIKEVHEKIEKKVQDSWCNI